MFLAVFVAGPFLTAKGVPAFQHDWVWPAYRSQLRDFAFAPFSPWQRAATGHPSVYPQFYPYYLAGALCCALAGSIWGLALFVAMIIVVMLAATDALLLTVAGKLHPASRAALLLVSVANPVWLNAMVAGHLKLLLAGAFATFVLAQALNSRARTMLTSIALALTAIQPQIFVLTTLVYIALRGIRRARLRDTGATVALATLGVAPLLTPLAFSGAVQSLGELSARYAWQIDQSQPLPDALRLTGYLARYAETRLTPATLALWYALPLLALFGLVREPRKGAPFAALALLLLTFATAFHTPLAPLAAFAFAHLSAATMFREMYNVDVLLVPTFLALAALALRPGLTRIRLVGVSLTALATVAAALLTAPHISIGIPTFTADVATDAVADRVAKIPGNDRYLVLPATYPVHPPAVATAGFSPFLFGIDAHPTLLSPVPDAALLHAYALIRERSAGAVADLQRLDVVSVSAVPTWRFGTDQMQPDLVRALPPPPPFVPLNLRLEAQRVTVEPFVDRPGTLDDGAAGARALEPLAGGRPVSLELFDDSPDPRFGWAKTQLFPLLPSWVYATDLGVFTLRDRAFLRIPDSLIVAADAAQGPSGEGCERVAQLDLHHVVLHCRANPTLSGRAPIVISEVEAGARLRQSSPQRGSYGTVSLRLSWPWMVVADVSAPSGSALVLREGFDHGWRVWGTRGEHLRVDGYANGWRLSEPINGTVILYQALSLLYFLSTGVSIAVFAFTSFRAIRATT